MRENVGNSYWILCKIKLNHLNKSSKWKQKQKVKKKMKISTYFMDK